MSKYAPKIAKMDQHFAFSMLKSTPDPKSTPLLVVAVVTKMSNAYGIVV